MAGKNRRYETEKVDKPGYINIKCGTLPRYEIYERTAKKAADKGISMADFILQVLDRETAEYKPWYEENFGGKKA